MRRFYGYGVFAVAMVVGLAVMVSAQPPAGGQGMRGQGQGPGMRGQGMGPGRGPMAALKLTDEQQRQLRTLMQTERETHQAAMDQVRELRKQLHEKIYGSGDEAAALALAGEIASFEAKARIHMQMAAAAILTAEQRKIVVESGMEFPPQMGLGGRGGQGPGKK
jgi:Spy/CpxP family protein refolding chaperone